MGENSAPQPVVNPYAAPRAAVEDVGQGSFELAGRRQRLGAAFVDGILYFLIGMLGGFLSGAGESGMLVAIGLAFIAVTGVNLVLLHRRGQTIGKYSFDIKIVRSSGERAGLARLILLRGLPQWVLSAFPFLNLLNLVDVLFIFREDRRCVHDHIADTTVIKS
jgi:uncharacterized RDD family membrane protein YckC